MIFYTQKKVNLLILPQNFILFPGRKMWWDTRLLWQLWWVRRGMWSKSHYQTSSNSSSSHYTINQNPNSYSTSQASYSSIPARRPKCCIPKSNNPNSWLVSTAWPVCLSRAKSTFLCALRQHTALFSFGFVFTSSFFYCILCCNYLISHRCIVTCSSLDILYQAEIEWGSNKALVLLFFFSVIWKV